MCKLGFVLVQPVYPTSPSNSDTGRSQGYGYVPVHQLGTLQLSIHSPPTLR